MSKKQRNKLVPKQPVLGEEPVPVVHDPNPERKKTIVGLQEEYNNVFLVRCPYCQGSGNFPYGFGQCKPCLGHGIIDSRTFKYPVEDKKE